MSTIKMIEKGDTPILMVSPGTSAKTIKKLKAELTKKYGCEIIISKVIEL